VAILEQLSKQDQILEQIAYIAGLLSQKLTIDEEKPQAIEKYLESASDYAASVCGDSVSDEVALEMQNTSRNVNVEGNHDTLSPQLNLRASMANNAMDYMTIVIGNTHRLVRPWPGYNRSNKHLWSFYVRVSGEAIVQDVTVLLVSTRNDRLVFLQSLKDELLTV
jgi:hypothetical protein